MGLLLIFPGLILQSIPRHTRLKLYSHWQCIQWRRSVATSRQRELRLFICGLQTTQKHSILAMSHVIFEELILSRVSMEVSLCYISKSNLLYMSWNVLQKTTAVWVGIIFGERSNHSQERTLDYLAVPKICSINHFLKPKDCPNDFPKQQLCC